MPGVRRSARAETRAFQFLPVTVRARVAGYVVALSLLLAAPGLRSESSLAAGGLAARDDQGFASDWIHAEWLRDEPSSGHRLTVGWYRYSLDQNFSGVLPFEGSHAAVELGGHLMRGLWWYGAAVGFHGTPGLDGATGRLVLARAFPTSLGTVTPRLEAAREPLATSALPLSLALFSERVQAALGWRGSGWSGEGGVRLDRWESATVAGRVQNAALDTIAATRITTVYGYALSEGDGWLHAGLVAKATWASPNTLLATQIEPSWAYSWYPASAPAFAWETALVVRAAGRPAPTLEASLQLQLPALSRETRQWESLQKSYWGTAPLEALLEGSWLVLSSTAVQVRALFFAKPWERWNVVGAGAYRQATVELSLKQSI
jgi:hypothetical protein